MNCSEARPLLAAGDPAADAHLEGCADCGEWLEANDPVVLRFRSARPEALPAPAGLKPSVLRRLAQGRSGWRGAIAAAALTGALVAAALAALAYFQQPLLNRLADYAAPLQSLFEGPRDLLAGNLPALVLTAALTAVFSFLAGLVYRDLGHPPRSIAR